MRPALVKLPAGQDPLRFAETLMSDPRVDFAEPNYYLEALSAPNDPFYEEQWNMRDFGLEQAWAIEQGDDPRDESEDVIIAVMDTGIDADHPDIKDKLLPGCDFFDKDNDPTPVQFFLGPLRTARTSAGIAAAIGNNNEGIAGVAYGTNVKLLPVKVSDDAGLKITLNLVIDALLWLAGEDIEGAAKNPFPPNIINMSLGGRVPAGELRSLNRATTKVREAGILMIDGFEVTNYVQGGDNNGVRIPAADENVLAVGSVDRDYQRSGFSQFNDKPPRPGVDLMAPGGYTNVGACNVGRGGVLKYHKI